MEKERFKAPDVKIFLRSWTLCAAVMLKWLLKRKSEIIAFYGLKCSVRTVGTHFREKKIILGPPGGARGGQRGVWRPISSFFQTISFVWAMFCIFRSGIMSIGCGYMFLKEKIFLDPQGAPQRGPHGSPRWKYQLNEQCFGFFRSGIMSIGCGYVFL